MANNLAQNPLKVDTAMTVSLRNFQGPAYLPFGRFSVHHVDWIGPANSGDTYTITDGAGNTISSGKISTGQVGLQFAEQLGLSVTDLQVTQISSGTLLIHLRQALE